MGSNLQPLGRAMVLFGLLLTGFGILLLVAPKLPGLGRLPGDIVIQRERFSFYFPLASCVLASVLLSVIMWLVSRFRP